MGYNFILFISPLQNYDTLTGSYRFQQSWLISTDGFGVHPTSSEPLSVQVDRRLTRRELSAGNTQFPTLQVRYPLTEDGQLGFRGLKATQEKDYLQRHQGPSRCSASDRKTYIAHSEARAFHTVESLPPLKAAWLGLQDWMRGVSRPQATLHSGGGQVGISNLCPFPVPSRYRRTVHEPLKQNRERRLFQRGPDPGLT